jgi:hypothetical protein
MFGVPMLPRACDADLANSDAIKDSRRATTANLLALNV